MSKLSDLQDFLEKQRRNPDLGPVDRTTYDTRGSAEKDKDMLAETNRAMAEDREKARVEAARAGMAEVMTDRLKEHDNPTVTRTPEDTGEIAMLKEGGGGGGAGGAGGAGGLAGGGTVAVASDPGVFTNTYGGDSKRRLGMTPAKKKKKKKGKKKEKDKAITSGVTKLDRFLRGEKVNQTRKSVSVQEFATWLVEDALVKDLDPTRRRPGTGGVPSNYVDDIPTGKSRPSRPRPGTPAKGQSEFKNFEKMENISRVLETGDSILNLMKAIDMDIPVEVD